MALEVGSIVRVTAQITPSGLLRRDFGRTLFLYQASATTDADIWLRNRGVRSYASASALAADYPTGGGGDEAVAASEIYFQQSPFPRNLLIGAWFRTAQPEVLVGGDSVTTQAALRALGTFTLAIGSHTTGGLDFSAVADLDAAAGVIQGGLDTQVSGATAAAQDGRLVVTFPAGSITEAQLAAGFTSGTNLTAAASLGIAGSSDIRIIEGQAAETIAAALNRIEAIDDSWYYLALGASIQDTTSVDDVASWVAARAYMLALDTTDDVTLTPNESTSASARLAELGQNRVFAFWSRSADYKALSMAARFSSINFSAPNSLITGKFKSLPGTVADDLTTTGKAELDRKRVNHYSPFGGDRITAEGTTFGTWIDVQVWLDWFVDAIRVAVYGLLRRSPARVPQTDRGVAAIQDVVEGVCEQGVLNGGIAPGQLSAALRGDVIQATGNEVFDGFLTAGYLVHIPSVASQATAEREARRAPPVRVWAKGSGAVHFVDIDIVFEN